MVSLVVPAHDEEALLPRTLRSLRESGDALGRPFEIIVADDASEDATAEVARAAGARVVSVAHRQISRTRNAGARAATGDVLVFVDADTVLPARTLAAALAVIDRGGVAGGCVCTFDGPIPPWARTILRPMMVVYRLARLTPGAFLFCTREAFERVGGFDETMFAGEEAVMARALDRFARSRGTRFTIVREPIITSGRKLRAHSAGELLGTLLRLGLRGRRGVGQRAGLELWYGPRRADPAGTLDTPDREGGAR